ncbi:MAG: c-type cytochrome [Alphaproteobacteria bacterium]
MARRLGGLALAALMLAAVTASAEPAPERRDELLYRLRQDCGSCHGMTLKGGLGPSLLPDDIGWRSDEVLADIVLNGVPDTPMPPWAFEITPEEALWLVRQLKSGVPDAPANQDSR